METLELFNIPAKLFMDYGLDTCQIFTTVNKDQYTNFGFLGYLTEKYLRLVSKFFPGKFYATNGVFYLKVDLLEAMKCVAFCNHSGEDEISCDYLIQLDQRYNKYLHNVCSEVNYCTSVTGEMKK